MSRDIIWLDIRNTARRLGIGIGENRDAKNPWYGYTSEDAHKFTNKLSEILRTNPDATELHAYGLMPIEIAFSMGWMIGQAGLKPKYARSNHYLMDLPIPYGAYYESEELGFV